MRGLIGRNGQVSGFVVVAVIVVAIAVLFFAFGSDFSGVSVPASLEPAYVNFLSCLEEDLLTGISALESRGGYIELPAFEPGSRHMPFSSQLDFLGNNIPYWYYVSGNGIAQQQVPTISSMEEDLANFVEGQISNCAFDNFYEQGFEISFETSSGTVEIEDKLVRLNLEMDLSLLRNNDSVIVSDHVVEVSSQLGELYSAAIEIYEYEQESLFLENYGVDNLRSYAPVDGVEIDCSPLVWNAEEVFDELEEAIELNTLALRTRGNDFSLVESENEYFVVDLDTGKNVRFLNSRNWPNAFEVGPSNGVTMIVEPVGNQPGLGALGFCYIPYHFVYNVKYPVLTQIYSENGEEIFQFPMAVVIQGNKPREADLRAEAVGVEVLGLCESKNTFTQVNVIDSSGTPLSGAEISYTCSSSTCEIGQSINGVLEMDFPQCVNGFVSSRLEGYKDSKVSYSVVGPGSVDVIMNRLYPLNLILNLDGSVYEEEAIVSFISSNGTSSTIVYPEQRVVELSEGQYEVRVSIYKEGNLELVGTTTEQCIDVPKEGVEGLFGLTEKECFEVNIPEQLISSVLVGGGNQNYFILESFLEDSSSIEIGVESISEPKTLEELQNNYAVFETKGLEIEFI